MVGARARAWLLGISSAQRVCTTAGGKRRSLGTAPGLRRSAMRVWWTSRAWAGSRRPAHLCLSLARGREHRLIARHRARREGSCQGGWGGRGGLWTAWAAVASERGVGGVTVG